MNDQDLYIYDFDFPTGKQIQKMFDSVILTDVNTIQAIKKEVDYFYISEFERVKREWYRTSSYSIENDVAYHIFKLIQKENK